MQHSPKHVIDLLKESIANPYSLPINATYATKGRLVHFIRSKLEPTWDMHTLCAVSSTAAHNPNLTIVVHTVTDLSYPIEWKHFNNIIINFLSEATLTKLMTFASYKTWYEKFVKISSDPRALSDALRLILVVSALMSDLLFINKRAFCCETWRLRFDV